MRDTVGGYVVVLIVVAFALVVGLGLLDELLLWLDRRHRRKDADRARMRSSAGNYVARGGDLVTMQERMRRVRQTRPML